MTRPLRHGFYVGMAFAAILSNVEGFSHSFYREAGQTPPLHVLVHATLFASWSLLFLVQTLLAASARHTVHRRLGILGALIAAAMIVSGPPLAIAAARRGTLPGDPLAFLLVILLDIVFFALFVAAALWLRRDPERHKRYMLLATTSIVPPGVSRWPIAIAHPFVIPLVVLGFLVAPLAYDRLSQRPLSRVSLWGGLVLLVSIPVRFALSATSAWHAVARWLTR